MKTNIICKQQQDSNTWGRWTRISLLLIIGLFLGCSSDDLEPVSGTSEPDTPIRLGLASTPWPIFHANTYATASASSIGPANVSNFQAIAALTSGGGQPYVSPWTVVGEAYSSGVQPIYTTPNDGIAKYLIENGQLKATDFLALDRDIQDYDWNVFVLEGNLLVTTEIKRGRFVVIGDIEDSPDSALEVKYYVNIDPEEFGELTTHYTLSDDGFLIALTWAGKLIAVDLQEREVVASIDLPGGAGYSFHNSFPIDREGRIYLSSQKQLSAYDWNGVNFSAAWSAEYDMRGPGCEDYDENISRQQEILNVALGALCTGSGTTPSLIGEQRDGIVVLIDGHAPQNNIVAFWRSNPPSDWQAIEDPNNPGTFLDRQVAGVFPLPYSTPEGEGFTAENSPAVLGNSIVTAQWAGFSPRDSNPKGVQRVDWNPGSRQFELIWANGTAHFNGVPTIACSGGKCNTYGMGIIDGTYIYQALDFATGLENSRIVLGTDADILDQGNNHAVTSDGSIVYSGRFKMVRVN